MSELQWTLGIHAVSELLRQRAADVEELLIQDDRRDRRLQSIHELASQFGIRPRLLTRQDLDRLVGPRHQGVAARLAGAAPALDEAGLVALLERLDHPPLLLILDGVTDPHNLGACLRSADAAGVDAVVAPKDKAVGLNATVRKVASGAAETVPLVQVTNLARCLERLKSQGVWLIGTADQAATDLYDQDLCGPIALIMGSEGKGLRRLTREACDFLVAIPMAGALSSLNVSVAAGVVLFEAVRQRRARA